MKLKTSIGSLLLAALTVPLSGSAMEWTRGDYQREIQRGAEREHRRTYTDNEMRITQTQAGKDIIGLFGNRVRVEESVAQTASNQYVHLILNRSEGQDTKAAITNTFNRPLPKDLSTLRLWENQNASLTFPLYYLTSQNTFITNGMDSFQDTKTQGGIFVQNVGWVTGPTESDGPVVYQHYFLREKTETNGQERFSVSRFDDNPMEGVFIVHRSPSNEEKRCLPPLESDYTDVSLNELTSEFSYGTMNWTHFLPDKHPEFYMKTGWTDGKGTNITNIDQFTGAENLYSTLSVWDQSFFGGPLTVVASPNTFNNMLTTKFSGAVHEGRRWIDPIIVTAAEPLIR